MSEIENYTWPCGTIWVENEKKKVSKRKFKGGCGKDVNILESYRCVDCAAWFHRDCLEKHFDGESLRQVEKRHKKQIKEFLEWLNTDPCGHNQGAHCCFDGSQDMKEKIKQFLLSPPQRI